jgi:hypothetical protein
VLLGRRAVPLLAAVLLATIAAPAPASELRLTSSFAGAVDTGGGVPPDVQGAAGPEHLLVMLNTIFVVQRKGDGAVVKSWTPASFWSPVSDRDLLFDPRVLFDPLAGRWIAAIATEGMTGDPAILLAVSDAADPTGGWTFRKLAIGAGNYGEFPLVGFNARWIVVSSNLISGSTGYLAGSAIWAIDKESSAASRFTLGSPGSPLAPASTFDADEPDEMLLQQGPSAGGTGRANLYRISPEEDGSAALSSAKVIAAPAAWRDYPSPLESLPQAGSTRRIISDQDEFSSVCLRHGKIWAVQTATVPASATAPLHTAVQWWRITRDGVLDGFGRIEDAAGSTWVAFPSIAVNAADQALIGYSVFSADAFASAGYSLRPGCGGDAPLSAIHLLKAGEAPYERPDGAGHNRWGDLSQTVADPDGAELWTIQEFAAAPGAGGSRWGTWWGGFAASAGLREGACVAAPEKSGPSIVKRPAR